MNKIIRTYGFDVNSVYFITLLHRGSKTIPLEKLICMDIMLITYSIVKTFHFISIV